MRRESAWGTCRRAQRRPRDHVTRRRFGGSSVRHGSLSDLVKRPCGRCNYRDTWPRGHLLTAGGLGRFHAQDHSAPFRKVDRLLLVISEADERETATPCPLPCGPAPSLIDQRCLV